MAATGSEPAPLTRQLARSGSMSFGGAATSALMGFIFTFVLARTFGEAGAGVVFQAVAVFSISLGVVKLGMDSVAVWLLPRLVLGRAGEIRASLIFMAVLVFGASVLGSTVLNLIAPAVAGEGHQADELRTAIETMSWFLPVAALLMFALAATRGIGSILPYVLIGSVGVPTLRPLLVLGVWWLGGSVVMAAFAWALPLPFGLVAAYLVLRHGVRRAEPSVRSRGSSWPTKSARRTITRFALPRTVSAGLDQSILWLDVVLVGMLAGPAAAGVYAGASRFIAAGLIVDTALRVVVAPQFSALLHEQNLAEVQELYRVAAMWLVFFSAPIYVILAVFAPTVLAWFGPDFVAGAPALTILAVGAVVTFIAGNIHSVLLMAGHSGWAAFNKAVVLLVNVLGNLVLVPRIGIVGAALSWAISMLMDAALASIQVRLLVGVRLEALPVLRALAAPVVAVGGPATVYMLLMGADSLSAMLLAIGSGGVILSAWAWLDRRHLQLSDLLTSARQRAKPSRR